jgi:hypothetical protein
VESDDRDRCICDTPVAPHWTAIDDDAEGRHLQRGSCTACGLQLVRFEGERWRHIRG